MNISIIFILLLIVVLGLVLMFGQRNGDHDSSTQEVPPSQPQMSNDTVSTDSSKRVVQISPEIAGVCLGSYTAAPEGRKITDLYANDLLPFRYTKM